MWQLRLSDLDEREKVVIGCLISNLDADGYLRLAIEEVAFMANADLEEIERALRHLQSFDPPGAGARSLSECLLLQLRHLGLGGSLAATLVRDHLPALEGKRFDKLARELKVSTAEIADAQRVIATLEPKPGRDYGDGDMRYVTPDVYIQKVGDEYVVTLNDEGLPRLRVSQFYRRVLGQGESSEAKGYIQEKMRAAAWLIKSIHQRQRTLFMVTHSIIKFQREFFEHGVSHLRPLVLKDVANDIGMHESTVSRATANKYVHTPQGIFELKYFFTSSLRGADGEDVSAESVRKKIKRNHRQRGPVQPVQRPVHRREAGEGQHRHCAPDGGEVSGADGYPAFVQAPAIRLSWWRLRGEGAWKSTSPSGTWRRPTRFANTPRSASSGSPSTYIGRSTLTSSFRS